MMMRLSPRKKLILKSLKKNLKMAEVEDEVRKRSKSRKVFAISRNHNGWWIRVTKLR